MEIKVLGPGCANCVKLEKVVKEAVADLGLDAQVVKVSEIKDIMSYGVMSTPALVVDGQVKVSGRVPGKDEIKKMLQGGAAAKGCDCGNCCR
ncbi:MAG: thioredoxin family protein [Planctomycetaceae bacterium]|nr:MAG: thioredoxin family protein [Planctomycetaceae bacterium]